MDRLITRPRPSAWQADYPASTFANLVYNVSSVSTMQADVSLAASRNTAWFYATDANVPNPYGAPAQLLDAAGCRGGGQHHCGLEPGQPGGAVRPGHGHRPRHVRPP